MVCEGFVDGFVNVGFEFMSGFFVWWFYIVWMFLKGVIGFLIFNFVKLLKFLIVEVYFV